MLSFKQLAAVVAMIGGLLAGAETGPCGAASAVGDQSPAGGISVMKNIVWFHQGLLYLITAIVLFVLLLLVIVIVRFNSKANPVPSRTTHNT